MTEKQQRYSGILLAVSTVINLAAAVLLVIAALQMRILKGNSESPAPEANSSGAAAEQSSQEEYVPSAAPVSEGETALYQAQCREIPYSEMARSADALKRQYFTFTGRIVQAMEDTYRLGVKNGSDYSDVVYLDYTPPAGGERLLEDDYVTVWGQSEGFYTYTSVSDEKITVPRLHVGVLKRLTDEEVAALDSVSYMSLEIAPETKTDPETGVQYTLAGVCVRDADADDLDSAPLNDNAECVFLLFDIKNGGTEDFDFSHRSFVCYEDSYETDPEVSYYDSPEGFGRLKSTTLEPDYGIRGHLELIVRREWQTLEVRVSPNVRFTVARSGE